MRESDPTCLCESRGDDSSEGGGIIAFLVLILVAAGTCFSQQARTDWESLADHKAPLVGEWHLQAEAYHRHQDFFDQVFSLQGVRTGVVLNRWLFLEGFGAAFATNLDVERAAPTSRFWMAQAGISLGAAWRENEILHPGWRLDAGWFRLKGMESDRSGFLADPALRLDGLVLSPQVFAEINASDWTRFQIGMGCSFYSFEPTPVVAKSDLETVFIDFVFAFGSFRPSPPSDPNR